MVWKTSSLIPALETKHEDDDEENEEEQEEEEEEDEEDEEDEEEDTEEDATAARVLDSLVPRREMTTACPSSTSLSVVAIKLFTWGNGNKGGDGIRRQAA